MGQPRPGNRPSYHPAEIHEAMMMLTEDERKDRAIVNETLRTGRTPLRPAGSADLYGVPIAEE
jgi:hypothetical protein